mmetsp:Transcript_10220/g.33484  ORF Transcript_10220/g.33484 Transcript_10220/m.33484 type:complete len:249 (+) Transcript_10220:1024-1770(+)
MRMTYGCERSHTNGDWTQRSRKSLRARRSRFLYSTFSWSTLLAHAASVPGCHLPVGMMRPESTSLSKPGACETIRTIGRAPDLSSRKTSAPASRRARVTTPPGSAEKRRLRWSAVLPSPADGALTASGKCFAATRTTSAPSSSHRSATLWKSELPNIDGRSGSAASPMPSSRKRPRQSTTLALPSLAAAYKQVNWSASCQLMGAPWRTSFSTSLASPALAAATSRAPFSPPTSKAGLMTLVSILPRRS